MIYQLYPNKHLVCEPFSKYYSTICLDCLDKQYLPELKMEYTGMIYLWKNNLDSDNWIGFTSYRQKHKSKFILESNNIEFVLSKLNQYDILCFLYLKFKTSISTQAENCHKNIIRHIKYILYDIYHETIPDSFFIDNCGCFANYWIMSKNNFYEFMEWSYPKVLKILELSKSISYFTIDKHLSNSGFIIERLFIIWYLKFSKKIFSLS